MIQRPFISSRYDRMKHTSQIPEETVNRFINESMKTKTMLEAKKKAKNFDYSNEGGAGKRERQEMEEPQGGKKESKWSKFKKAMNNAAGRVTSGDRFIRDTGMKMDHQEHEGELQNEVTKKRKKAQEELEQAARENKPTNRKLRRRFRGSGKARQLDIATTHGGRMPGESYSKN